MKKTNLNILVWLFILPFIFYACKKDEPSSVGFKMKAVDTQSQGLKSTGAAAVLPLTWDTALIVVSKLEFEAEYHESNDQGSSEVKVKLEWEGNMTVDLMAEPQVFATIELPDGTYDEIELKVKSKEMPGSDNPNFYLAGILTTDIATVPIVLIVDDDFEIETKVEDWVINTQNGSFFDGIIEISLAQLFNGISLLDLSNATLVDGRIVISSSVNAGLYAKIVGNIGSSGDCDHNGEDDDEGEDNDD